MSSGAAGRQVGLPLPLTARAFGIQGAAAFVSIDLFKSGMGAR